MDDSDVNSTIKNCHESQRAGVIMIMMRVHGIGGYRDLMRLEGLRIVIFTRR